MTTIENADTARNATLADLRDLLIDQHARKLDMVIPASTLVSEGGLLRVKGAEQHIDADGVTVVDGLYRPTEICDGHLAERFEIPVKYLRKMRAGRTDLLDANLNGWIHGASYSRAGFTRHTDPDPRSFLLRAFRNPVGDVGVARALLSDRYGIADHLDALTATLAGVRESGAQIEVVSADLTDRKMYVRIAAPGIAAHAPELLKNYRRPWGPGNAPWETESGRAHGWMTPDEQPIVFAGFVIENSEVGAGAFTITPEITVKVCRNGLVIKADAMRAVHLGSKLDEGVIRWSEDTARKHLDLITAKARDAVANFLSADYVARTVAALEAKAGVPVTNAQATIERVGKTLRFSDTEISMVLDHFIAGGQLTAGGVMNAVTSYAQQIPDADRAYEFGALGVEAMQAV